MKKVIYILITAIMLPVFSSCADMLEEKNYGNPTMQEMMSNPENVALLVGQIYADLKWVHDHWGYWGVNSLTTDEAACPIRYPIGDWNDDGYWKNLNTHNWTWRGGAFENIWNTTISGAVLCNKLVKSLTDNKDYMDPSVYKQYIGELEVMRSYYFYLLFDSFGRIPYLETYEKESTDPLMEPQEVWSRLVMCLERNAPNMPKVTDENRAQHYGRVTQGFAYALLARLYLNAPSFDCTPENISLTDEFHKEYTAVTRINSETDFYTNAVRCCDNVIESGSYHIASDFFSNFKIKNEDSKENIFVIVENGLEGKDERSGAYGMNTKLRILNNTLHPTHQAAWNRVDVPWNGFCARPSHVALYNENDLRGAGPGLPEGCPQPPYVMTKKEYAASVGKDESSVDDKKEYEPYRQKALQEYAAASQEWAAGLKDFGTGSPVQRGWFIGPVWCPQGDTVLRDNQGFVGIILPELLFNATEKDNNRCHGARFTKYEVDKTPGQTKYQENDFVLMRYADVLWMKEEAILRGGAGASSFHEDEFQRMLTRTFAACEDPKAAFEAAYPDLVTLDAGDLDQAILDERGREFVWELVRRRDLLRFGKFDKVEYVTNTAPHLKWFPIPFAIIEKSLKGADGQSIWTQNPGY